jgi:L-aspartate oxidase
VFARRAIDHALAEPAANGPTQSSQGIEALRERTAPPAADASTREALWRDAGIERSEDGLQRLLASPHPLARLIARCALARAESRGAHRRIDHPERDPALDHRHVVVSGDEALEWQTWT